MERKFYTDNFEQLLKEKSDEFRMYPSKRVWHSIYNDLHPGRKWPSVAVSMILIIALLLTGYWNNNSASKTIASTSSSPKNNTITFSDNSANNTVSQLNTVLTADGNSTNNTAEKITAQDKVESTTAANTNLAGTGSAIKPNTGINSAAKIFNTTSLSNVTADNAIALQAKADAAAKNSTITSVQKSNAGTVSAVNNDQFNTAAGTTAAVKANTSALELQQNTTKATVSATVSGIKMITSEEIVAATDLLQSNEETKTADGNDEINLANSPLTNKEPASTVIAANDNNIKEKITADEKETKEDNAAKSKPDVAKKVTSADDKSWMEDYAFHNKSKRKKWQDRTALEFYVTPGVTYRTISNDPKYNIPAATPSFASSTVADASTAVNQKPGLGFEAGLSINYSLAKNIRVKAGIQANYTSYGVNATETNHPVLTTLMLLDPNSGYPYMHSASSTLSNLPGSQPVKVHNQTYQVSIPVGFALKLAGTNKLEWYAGATIQPSFVIGGKAYLISADRKNYVADPSLIRKWNLNTGFETFINYKLDGFTLQAGPQFRYQLLSNYYNKYTVKENLYNVGLKIGILKNF